ncbi:universal stress protein UspE [Catenovulum agarivorans DS-2]|uniref:Universal stress protein UspE n=1 Tax=Catenovulum agarivorans DS-2 TaxID=1328313 RepID=W7QK33_9ALTE|nr:universal stress protein UspE [Catenovulum agarivorans]EWH12271.1 universal stress protein UspE [Catenovulum agarivorans DS-2]
MKEVNKILVVIEPSDEQLKALKRAVALANKTGASVTAYLAVYDFSYEMTTMLSAEERELMRRCMVEERTQWLEDVLEPYANEVSVIRPLVEWHNRPFEAVIKQVIQYNYDLVVKATHEHSILRSVIFTPTDWHLLRKCPCSVLLVKEHDWPTNGTILAAINSVSQEQQHIDLNNNIISTAQYMQSLLEAKLKLLNCFPGSAVSLAVEIPEFDPTAYRQAIRQHHLTSTLKYAQAFEIDEDNCILAEGLPEDTISRQANELDAELIVLGTIGRSGISAALLGNTAEHLLDGVNCDVLALKPYGFQSPVTLNKR